MRAPITQLAVAIGLSMLAAPAYARPGTHTVRVEGVGALHVGDQFSRFDFGGGFALGYELRPIPLVGVEARYRGLWWRVAQPRPGTLPYGDYHSIGAAARVHPVPDLDAGDLWIDAGLNLVVTGTEARPGIEIGAGFEIETAWFLRIGPFVRFSHVFQPDDDALGAPDASILQLGVSFAFLGEEPRAAVVEDGDADGDGIRDSVDQCRDVPEDFDGDRDEDGCPEEPGDADGDGILDSTDRCVNEPEDRDGFEDADGCPDPDNDGDGILDVVDRCPLQPETRNGYEDQDGCPDEAPGEAELRQLTDRIFFPHDRAQPAGESRRAIARVAELIVAHQEWVRIEIEGHASDTGAADYNMQLSQRRAERVRELLVEAGVDPARLVVRAYGQTRPFTSGESETAHALNRRVTFTVLERR